MHVHALDRECMTPPTEYEHFSTRHGTHYGRSHTHTSIQTNLYVFHATKTEEKNSKTPSRVRSERQPIRYKHFGSLYESLHFLSTTFPIPRSLPPPPPLSPGPARPGPRRNSALIYRHRHHINPPCSHRRLFRVYPPSPPPPLRPAALELPDLRSSSRPRERCR